MQKTSIFLYAVKVVASAIFLMDGVSANWKKCLRILYFTFYKERVSHSD